MKRMTRTTLICLVIGTILSLSVPAYSLREGGYVARSEPLALTEVYSWLTYFSYEYYRWAYPSTFTSNRYGVDEADVSFFCGHGGNWCLATKARKADVFFTSAIPLGDYTMEHLSLYSCSVIPSPIEVGDLWDDYWWDDFRRLHQLHGFHDTAFFTGGAFPSLYASYLNWGFRFLDSWIWAANARGAGPASILWAYPQGSYPGAHYDRYRPYTHTDPPTYLSVLAMTYTY